MARHPLQSQEFGEGVRQKWAMILIAVMFVIMAVNVVNAQFAPGPYLTFLTFIGSFLLGGLTATAWVQANRAETLTNVERIEGSQTINQNTTITRRQPKDFDVSMEELTKGKLPSWDAMMEP